MLAEATTTARLSPREALIVPDPRVIDAIAQAQEEASVLFLAAVLLSHHLRVMKAALVAAAMEIIKTIVHTHVPTIVMTPPVLALMIDK